MRTKRSLRNFCRPLRSNEPTRRNAEMKKKSAIANEAATASNVPTASTSTGGGPGKLGDHPSALVMYARPAWMKITTRIRTCLLYTSDAADDLLCVDLGGRRIIKKKKKKKKK